MLGFNDTSTLVGHFVLSTREKEKRDRRDSRGDERGRQGRKREMKESEGTEELTTPSTLTCCKDSRPCPTVSQYQLGALVTKATGHFFLTQPPQRICVHESKQEVKKVVSLAKYSKKQLSKISILLKKFYQLKGTKTSIDTHILLNLQKKKQKYVWILTSSPACWLKRSPHCLHSNTLAPVCKLRCVAKTFCNLKDFPQNSQICGRSSPCRLRV